MFGLFKRTKVLNWEKELLINSFEKMRNDISKILINQVKDDLLRGVLLNISDIPGYVAFTYNTNVIDKYELRNERDYALTDIKVFDKKSSKFLNYTIFISTGTISGYSITGAEKYEIDTNNVNVSSIKKKYNDESKSIDYIFKGTDPILLSKLDLQNSFTIEVNEGIFYVIKDLEDGNYLAIDDDGIVYGLIHDPYEIEKLYDSKEIFLNDLSSGKFNIEEYYSSKF